MIDTHIRDEIIDITAVIISHLHELPHRWFILSLACYVIIIGYHAEWHTLTAAAFIAGSRR